MSKDWVKDIVEMQGKYGTRDWVNSASRDKLKTFLDFRLDFIEEEFDETLKAIVEDDAEEIVDGLIDLCVVAIGTLDAFGVDPYKAWDAVHKANMGKVVGVKPSRPNPLGVPDLIKPEGWTAPSHEGNHGILPGLGMRPKGE
ncbi:MAG: nucleoside triphosphate pyrophosphohydrolase family protein [Methylophagaceae bacterium]|jgi:predicted HAD superfamily Cof-like phosphohydrolase|tara:strand:- start:124 stop:549 length:426 start_codon:yes stop_codon:yes gene_type:complete